MLLSLLAGMLIILVRRLSFASLCSIAQLFVIFLAKRFVVSIIITTFAVELERSEKNGRDEGSND